MDTNKKRSAGVRRRKDTDRFSKETILNATHNQAIPHQSKAPAHNDGQTPAPQAASASPKLQNMQTSRQTLLHDFQKIPAPSEKPHAPVAPRYAPPNDATRCSEQSTSASRIEDAGLTATGSRHFPHQESATEPAFSPVPDAGSHFNINGEAASSRPDTPKVDRSAEGQKAADRKTGKHQSIDDGVSDAIRSKDFETAKKLLRQGAKPADGEIQDQLQEDGCIFYWLAASQDIETLHYLLAHTTPQIKQDAMEKMADYASLHKSPILMEYVARHSVISKWIIEDAPLDKSNGISQALIDGGVAFGKDSALYAAIKEAFPSPYDGRLASLLNKRNTAAQAFDAHRDGKYEQADTLFNPPAPVKENPLGLAENMRSKLSKQGLASVYQHLQHSHAGLISTMPDPLLTSGFRSEIVWILRSCQEECQAARKALTGQMSTNGLKLVYRDDNGNFSPCSGKGLEQLLFAFQLKTHERLIQIAQPPLKEEDKGFFNQVKSEIFSALNFGKNAGAKQAQAETLIRLAQNMPEIRLEFSPKIVEIGTAVLQKRPITGDELDFLDQQQQALENEITESKSGASPGTPLSELLIFKTHDNAIKRLAAIRRMARDNAASAQSQ